MPTANIIWKKRMTLAGNVHNCPRDLSTVDIRVGNGTDLSGFANPNLYP